MTRTGAAIFCGGFSVVCLVSAALVAGQAKPDGSPPLQKYHIRPDDLPKPTRGVSNPPMVVGKPDGASLNLPPGFKIDVFADEGAFKTLRYIIEGPDGDVFAADTSANTITICATRTTTARPTSDMCLPRA